LLAYRQEFCAKHLANPPFWRRLQEKMGEEVRVVTGGGMLAARGAEIGSTAIRDGAVKGQ
jgi:hypothetical protein